MYAGEFGESLRKPLLTLSCLHPQQGVVPLLHPPWSCRVMSHNLFLTDLGFSDEMQLDPRLDLIATLSQQIANQYTEGRLHTQCHATV